MLTRAWKKIDRFYLILSIVLVVLVAPLIYTVLGIFSAFVTAYEIDSSVGKEVRINTGKLDTAVTTVYDKEIEEIKVRETFIIPVIQVQDEEN